MQTQDEKWGAIAKQRDLKNHKFKGLKVNSVHPLRCSACGAPLVNVVVVKPDYDVTLKYRAECDHCGDRSFAQEIKGGIIYGPIDPDDPYTVVDGQYIEGDVVVFKTKKVKPYEG